MVYKSRKRAALSKTRTARWTGEMENEESVYHPPMPPSSNSQGMFMLKMHHKFLVCLFVCCVSHSQYIFSLCKENSKQKPLMVYSGPSKRTKQSASSALQPTPQPSSNTRGMFMLKMHPKFF